MCQRFLNCLFAITLALAEPSFCEGHNNAIQAAAARVKETVRPTPEVIVAWEKAGAQFGWIYITDSGSLEWLTEKRRMPESVAAFRFSQLPTGKANVLPSPGIPFGVYLRGSQVTDIGLKQLAGQKQLQILTFLETRITDRGMKELARLTNLQALSLSYSQLTDIGLKELAGLRKLQKLSLSGTRVTDAGLKNLVGMQQLRTLSLNETKVTDAGLKVLAQLVQLRKLNLSETRVTDAGLKELVALTHLQSLGLLATRVSNDGLKDLAKLQELQTLDVRATRVSGEVWRKELAGLKHLRTVSIDDRRYHLKPN